MNSESKERMLKSEVSYRIIQELSEKEKYAKELSEDVGSSRNSISNYINKLRDAGIIVRGKRTKAQYYKLSYEGLSEFWFNELKNVELEGSSETDYHKIFDDNESKIKETSARYFRDIIKTSEQNLTLYELLFETYSHSITRLDQLALIDSAFQDDSFPDYLVAVEKLIYEYMDLANFSPVLLRILDYDSYEELSEEMDQN